MEWPPPRLCQPPSHRPGSWGGQAGAGPGTARGRGPSPKTCTHTCQSLSWRGSRWDPADGHPFLLSLCDPLAFLIYPLSCVHPLPTTRPSPGSPLICPCPRVAPALSWGEVSLGPAFHPLSPEWGATAGPSPGPLARAVPWRTAPSAVAQPPHPKGTLSQTMSTLTHGHPHTCCAQAQGQVAKPGQGVHARGPALLQGC